MTMTLPERPVAPCVECGSETAVPPTDFGRRSGRMADVARRAAGLEARLHPHTAIAASGPNRGPAESAADQAAADPAAEARWTIWLEAAAGGDDSLMARRLEWDGLTIDEARHRLGASGFPPAAEETGWIRFLEPLDEASAPGPLAAAVDQAVSAAHAVPFAAAYIPFLVAATAPLQDAVERLGGRLQAHALADLVTGLLGELSRLAGRVLASEFAESLSRRGLTADPQRRAEYDDYTAEFATKPLAAGGGWDSIWTTYPVLARLVSTTCLAWTADTILFLDRLAADWDAVGRRLIPETGEPTPVPPAVSRLGGANADRHGGSAAVRVLDFFDGRRLVYKARPLDLEADFHKLLRALAAAGLPDAPPALLVLTRPGYGWIEFAEHAAVADDDALDAWFRSAGSLLCLLHVLGATDGHMENIVATRSGPILIDVETLLQPRRGSADSATPGTFAQAATRIRDSVLQTGLLPLWQSGRQGRPFDIGGLTGVGGYESPVLHPAWEYVGTNAVRPAWRRAVARGLRNLPVLGETRHAAGAHLPELAAGFSSAWRFLQAHRGLLSGALATWAAAPLRVLIRPTTHYATLLERSLALEALKSGLDRALLFETLRRPMVRQHAVKPAAWTAVAEEIRALENGDIPIFYANAGGRDLESADGRPVVSGAFGESAVQATLARLGQLTDAELTRQLELIAAAFIESDAAAAPPPAQTAALPVDIEAALATTPLASDAGLIATATVLGKQLVQAAIRGHDGFVTWIAPSSLHPGQRRQQGVSYYLYDGAAGIALFLAALARVTGDEAARSTALAALEPVRAVLDDARAAALIERESIGGCSGLASIVYALTVIAGLLDEPGLLDRAARVSRYIDETRIASDQALDIVGGSAGAVLALTALHRAGGGDEALDRAIACGRHLLARAERVGADGLAWPSWPDRLLLAGYSHGAAGVAAALGALYRATGDTAFSDAALAALRYERSLFDPAAGNWPILLPSGGSQIASTWCHGAPGILLGRAGLIGIFAPEEDDRIRAEMDTAARATIAAGLSPLDHLCCGAMGRVEILHTVATTLGGHTREIARLGATLTIQRARHRRAFSLQPDPVRNAVFQPGFFRGISGLGYSFLRLARPDALPAVLAWQTSRDAAP